MQVLQILMIYHMLQIFETIRVVKPFAVGQSIRSHLERGGQGGIGEKGVAALG
jgi:hypothetical protein